MFLRGLIPQCTLWPLPAHEFFYIGLKTTLVGFTLWKKIHELKKATEDFGAQSWSKTHILWFWPMISRHQKIKNLWILILLTICKTELPYHFVRLFLNIFLRPFAALKIQSDFKCIFLPKIYKSLRIKILWMI